MPAHGIPMRKFTSQAWFPPLLLLAAGPIQAGPRLPSKAFSEAFLRHNDRLQAGKANPAELIKDLRPLAEAGDPTAQFFLALYTLDTFESQALALLRASAKAGCPGAAGALGLFLLKENPKEGIPWINFAARAGDANSTFVLSASYLEGKNGMKLDKAMGLALAKCARDQSHSAALTAGLDALIKETEEGSNRQVHEKAASVFRSLQGEFPKVPFYLGGQSLP